MSVASFKKKVVYTVVSLLFGVLLLGSVGVDIIATLVYEDPTAVPSSYAVSLLLIQSANFYLLLLGFVYAVETQVQSHIILSVVAMAINVAALVGRLTVTVVFLKYRPISYAE